MAPVLPFLTDSEEQLDETVAAIAASGATHVSPIVLHLRPGAREWWQAWLARERPDLLPRYAELYGERSYAAKAYQDRITATIRRLAAAHGVGREMSGGGGGDGGPAPSWSYAARRPLGPARAGDPAVAALRAEPRAAEVLRRPRRPARRGSARTPTRAASCLSATGRRAPAGPASPGRSRSTRRSASAGSTASGAGSTTTATRSASPPGWPGASGARQRRAGRRADRPGPDAAGRAGRLRAAPRRPFRHLLPRAAGGRRPLRRAGRRVPRGPGRLGLLRRPAAVVPATGRVVGRQRQAAGDPGPAAGPALADSAAGRRLARLARP